MNALLLTYVVAVAGSFLARYYWWRQDNDPREIWVELRLGWLRYALRDLTACVHTAGLICSGNTTLEHHRSQVNALVRELTSQRGYDYFSNAPKDIQAAILSEASSRLANKLPNVERLMEQVKAGKLAARKATWVTCMVTLMHAPSKIMTALVCADGTATTVVSLLGPAGDDKNLNLTWSGLPNGESIVDIALSYTSHSSSPFLHLRDSGGGMQLGAGVFLSEEPIKGVNATLMFRALTNGTRGSPASLDIWPRVQYEVTDRLQVGAFAWYNAPITGRPTLSYGPCASYQITDSTSVYGDIWYPGGSQTIGLTHTIAGW